MTKPMRYIVCNISPSSVRPVAQFVSKKDAESFLALQTVGRCIVDLEKGKSIDRECPSLDALTEVLGDTSAAARLLAVHETEEERIRAFASQYKAV